MGLAGGAAGLGPRGEVGGPASRTDTGAGAATAAGGAGSTACGVGVDGLGGAGMSAGGEDAPCVAVFEVPGPGVAGLDAAAATVETEDVGDA